MRHVRNSSATKVAVLASVVLLLVLDQNSSAKVNDTVKARLTQLHQRVTQLENLLQHFSRDENDIYIGGANLHVVNGTGTTDGQPNGLGNVIVGYNEARGYQDVRTGSHMLVVGQQNNYTSFGGIVVGYQNETSGECSSVSGGASNSAVGPYSSVSGGLNRAVTGTYNWRAGSLVQTY
jgi:hypothetical protein